MVGITKTPGDNYGYRYNPDLFSGIYMTSVTEFQCHIVAKNRIKQDEAKRNSVRVNAVKSQPVLPIKGYPLIRSFTQ